MAGGGGEKVASLLRMSAILDVSDVSPSTMNVYLLHEARMLDLLGADKRQNARDIVQVRRPDKNGRDHGTRNSFPLDFSTSIERMRLSCPKRFGLRYVSPTARKKTFLDAGTGKGGKRYPVRTPICRPRAQCGSRNSFRDVRIGKGDTRRTERQARSGA